MRLTIVLVLLVVTIAPAHAYVDAGSGSYMLQLSLAGIMGLIFSIKLAWQRLRDYTANTIRSSRHHGTHGEA